MTNRDNAGRFAATSSANPSSTSPVQTFGYTKPYQHTNAATPPAPIDLAAKYGQQGGPRAARMPAGGPRALGMVSDLALQLAPPTKPEQQKPQQQQPVAEDGPTSPSQPPLKPQEPITQTPALPGTGRPALPAGPSAVESMTAGSPIPPAVDGLLRNHGTPPSFGGVALAGKYTRPSNPHQIIPGEVIDG